MSETPRLHPVEASRPPSEEALVSLLAVTPELNAAPDLRTGLEGVAQRLTGIVPYDNLAVLLLDELGRELRFELALGYPQGVPEHWRFGLGQGIVGSVAQSGEPIRSSAVERDPRYQAAAPGTRSELAVPLKFKDRIIGVLDLGRTGDVEFSADDQRYVSLLADSLAAAIDGRRLYQNVKEQARVLSILHEVNRELTSTLDRRQVLERVASRLANFVDFDVFSLYLWDESRGRLEPWIWFLSDRLADGLQPLELGEGITGTAAALRQLIRVPNVSVDPRFVACDSGVQVRSEIAVPLIFENRLIGVLDLESMEYDAFRLEHEQPLSTLASSLAIALANAETYEALQERQRLLDEDLETARKIQRQLLPRSTPWLRSVQVAIANQPARHLGGDFHDVLCYGDERVALAVGDVAGKGTSAALYANLTLGMLRELAAHSHPSPAEVLATLNERLVDLDVDRRFVAMTFAVFDATSRRLSLANAGLPYPYVARRRRVEEVEIGGIPLGQLRQAEYRELELELDLGDHLVLATDGISEARNQEGQAFGDLRTVGALQRLVGDCSRSLADGLLEAVQRFAGGTDPSDDRTVVVLRTCG